MSADLFKKLSLLLLLFYILTHAQLGKVLPLDVPVTQILLFPFVVACFFKFRLINFSIPRKLLLVALAGGLIGAGIAYGPPPDRTGSFLIARFPDDPLESETRIFREKVNEVAHKTGVVATRYFDAFTSNQDVRRFLARDPDARPVVWGTSRWMNISFPPKVFDQRLSEGAETVQKYTGLLVVNYVPTIGLSFKPQNGTIDFIAKLFAGYFGHEKKARKAQSAEADEAQLLFLSQASSLIHGWSDWAHRAFPSWVAGNRHLYASVENGKFQIGELNCAINSYNRARRYFKGGSNPELLAAVLNNEAIAFELRATFTGIKRDHKSAGQLLHLAMVQRNVRNPYTGVTYRSPYFARSNIHFFHLVSGHGKSRHAGKQHKKSAHKRSATHQGKKQKKKR